MTHFELRKDKRNRIILPKPVVESFNTDCVILAPNCLAGLVFPKGAKLKHVLKSVKILVQDLQHQIELGGEDCG